MYNVPLFILKIGMTKEQIVILPFAHNSFGLVLVSNYSLGPQDRVMCRYCPLILTTFCIDNARSSFSMSNFFAINDFYIINPASFYFLLDRICIKKPRSSYIPPFLKICLFQPVFHWIILK